MSIRVIDDVLACEYGRELASYCKKHDWQIDAIFALYYDLPRLFSKAEKSEKKRQENCKQIARKDFPKNVTEDFVVKTLKLTPYVLEKRKKSKLLVFPKGRFSGKLLSDILFLHKFPTEIEDRLYRFSELPVLMQIQEQKLKFKYGQIFHKEVPWLWSKEEVVKVFLTKVNKLRIL
jgi:hypothetical protein